MRKTQNMRNIALISILLLLISLGCKKENEDFQSILSSKTWKAEGLSSIFLKLNGERYDIVVLYKVTFEVNGEFEFVFSSLGIDPNGNGRLDTLIGNYFLTDLENRISFEATKPLSSLSDTIIENCDTIKYLIPDWHIKEFNTHKINVIAEKLDTLNNQNCFLRIPFEDFDLIPFEN